MDKRVYGYDRVSTKEQNLGRGKKNIEDWCRSNNYNLIKVFEDKQSGKNFDRARYTVLKEDVLQSGDILVIAEYDRLGRADETKNELEYFKKNDIRVIFLDIPTTQIDISSISDEMAKMILNCINDMLISFYDLMARTELQRKRKRQKEGIDNMRIRGEWEKYGRPRVVSKEVFAKEYEKVKNGNLKDCDLCRELRLAKSTYFRYKKELMTGN